MAPREENEKYYSFFNGLCMHDNGSGGSFFIVRKEEQLNRVRTGVTLQHVYC